MNLKSSLNLFNPSTTHKKLLLALTAGLLISTSAAMAEDKVLATVNGHNVTESQYKIAAVQSKIQLEKITPEQKKLLIEALVNRQLVLDEAIKAKYDKDPEVAARVKALTESYIAANYLATVAKKFEISEAEIKDYYDKEVVAKALDEYKARHILVKTEDEAKAIIKEIEAGADFSKLAKEKSTDTGSAAKGGDLGWFSPRNMVASFSKAITDLKKGELAKKPVKSQFGWHIIILDDQRPTTPPEFSAIKENIKNALVKIKLNDYLVDLNKKATIKVKE